MGMVLSRQDAGLQTISEQTFSQALGTMSFHFEPSWSTHSASVTIFVR